MHIGCSDASECTRHVTLFLYCGEIRENQFSTSQLVPPFGKEVRNMMKEIRKWLLGMGGKVEGEKRERREEENKREEEERGRSSDRETLGTASKRGTQLFEKDR